MKQRINNLEWAKEYDESVQRISAHIDELKKRKKTGSRAEQAQAQEKIVYYNAIRRECAATAKILHAKHLRFSQ